MEGDPEDDIRRPKRQKKTPGWLTAGDFEDDDKKLKKMLKRFEKERHVPPPAVIGNGYVSGPTSAPMPRQQQHHQHQQPQHHHQQQQQQQQQPNQHHMNGMRPAVHGVSSAAPRAQAPSAQQPPRTSAPPQPVDPSPYNITPYKHSSMFLASPSPYPTITLQEYNEYNARWATAAMHMSAYGAAALQASRIATAAYTMARPAATMANGAGSYGGLSGVSGGGQRQEQRGGGGGGGHAAQQQRQAHTQPVVHQQSSQRLNGYTSHPQQNGSAAPVKSVQVNGHAASKLTGYWSSSVPMDGRGVPVSQQNGGSHVHGTQQQQQQQAAPPPKRRRKRGRREMLRQAVMVQVLERLMRFDEYGWFAEPVPSNCIEYHSVIQRPIAFSDISAKLEVWQYERLEQLEEDVRLLYSNALTFNAVNSPAYMSALDIRAACNELMKDAVRLLGDDLKCEEKALDEQQPAVVDEREKNWPFALDHIDLRLWLSIVGPMSETEEEAYMQLALTRTAAAVAATMKATPTTNGTEDDDQKRDQAVLKALARSCTVKKLYKEDAQAPGSDVSAFIELCLRKTFDEWSKKQTHHGPTNPSGSARCEPYQPKPPRVVHPKESEEVGVVCRRGGVISKEKQEEDKALKDKVIAFSRLRKAGERVCDKVAVGVSRIHGLGLFAVKELPMDTVVMEYKGEYVRDKVGDKREADYRAARRLDYMFRIDRDLIIDGTVRGSVARYVNHSCDPNLKAGIFDKRILLVSKRDIQEGEELSYDYQFPLETAKIPCLCGAPNCRRTLN